ncbi:hypothetical protein FACS189460_4560 [Deltaproteobacteria bacterium]|nr:hypothetical protein FACS189460_4560 [Deltaproteobacteria bacterium]
MNGVGKNMNLIIKGARENNLKNIDVEIPDNKMTCITGVSGCGKSSLVYDTIFAESRRIFFESMAINSYGQKIMDKPDVDFISNLRPAIDVAQNNYNTNPRSTLGTITDISHFLRTIFALIIGNREKLIYKANDFSYNNPLSYCPNCKGLGEEYFVSVEKLIPDDCKSLEQGAVTIYSGNNNLYEMQLLEKFCISKRINMTVPFRELPNKQKNDILYSNDNCLFEIKYRTPKGRYKNTICC